MPISQDNTHISTTVNIILIQSDIEIVCIETVPVVL